MKVRVCGFSPARPPSWPLALAVALAACAAPALVDVDGQRLERPLLVAGVHNGWVAVDSSAGGVRAVLELRAETRPPETPPWEEDGLTLQFAGYPAIAPARLRCEEPRCCRPALGEVGCPRGAEPV